MDMNGMHEDEPSQWGYQMGDIVGDMTTHFFRFVCPKKGDTAQRLFSRDEINQPLGRPYDHKS